MRTYDDTFSGEKIYPGKVRPSPRNRRSKPPVALPITTAQPVPLPLSQTRKAGSDRHYKKLLQHDGSRVMATNITSATAGQTLHPRRQQDLPLPERQDRIPLPPAQEPAPYRLDDALPTPAQEGYL